MSLEDMSLEDQEPVKQPDIPAPTPRGEEGSFNSDTMSLETENANCLWKTNLLNGVMEMLHILEPIRERLGLETFEREVLRLEALRKRWKSD